METKIFYEWFNTDEHEGGHGICSEEKFDSLKTLSSRNNIFNILFAFTTKEDFIAKFILNNLGNQQLAEIFTEYYKYIWE